MRDLTDDEVVAVRAESGVPQPRRQKNLMPPGLEAKHPDLKSDTELKRWIEELRTRLFRGPR